MTGKNHQVSEKSPDAAPDQWAPRFALGWVSLVYAGVVLSLAYPALAGGFLVNPHSDLIFRVTDATSCRDCHAPVKGSPERLAVLDNGAVRGLIAKGKGAHGPGRFADCFRCHSGGRKGLEKYSDG